MFEIGKMYSRRDIHNELGGELQGYLPSSGRVVVAGCFSTSMNPNAPDEVLVGTGPTIQGRAEQLYEQGESVPVFVKRSANAWEHVGRYKAIRLSRDTAEIAAKQRHAGRSDVTAMLHLRRT